MPESNGPVAPGQLKVELCRRLDHWQELADYCGIPNHERRQFEHGLEARAIWDWLENRDRLSDLPVLLRGKGDRYVATQRLPQTSWALCVHHVVLVGVP